MVTATDTIELRQVGPTPRWTPLRDHPGQKAVWTSPARFLALPCGRRSGKSELAKRKLVRALPVRIPGCVAPRYVYGAPIQDQAREIAWQDLLDLIPDHWIPGGKHGPHVSYSRLTIETVFGSSIRVVGLDKPHRIEGKYLNGFVGDEWSDIRPGTFDRVIRPMLGDYGGWAILCGVPKRQGIGAAWYRQFCESIGRGEYPDAECYSWPASDILPEAEIKHAQRTLDPKDYAEQYDARWQTAAGGVFYAFDREYNVRECLHRDGSPILVGMDFNIDPMAWCLCHRLGDRLEAFDEIWVRDCNTPRALDLLWQRWGHHQGGWQFYGDASSRSRKTSAYQSDYAHIWNDQRFQKSGRSLHFPSDNPPVEDRFSAANALLFNAAQERRAFFDPKCQHTITDLEMRSYKPGTREPADSGDVGHPSDAWSYIVHRLFPIRFEVKGTAAVITGRRT